MVLSQRRQPLIARLAELAVVGVVDGISHVSDDRRVRNACHVDDLVWGKRYASTRGAWLNLIFGCQCRRAQSTGRADIVLHFRVRSLT